MVSGVVERREFRTIADATLSEFFTQTSRDAGNYSLRMTSGTTDGFPLLIMWDNTRAAHRLFTDAKRVVLCSGLLSVRLGNALLVRNGMAAHDARVLCIDMQDVTHALVPLVGDFSPTAFYGFPSFVMRVAPYVRTGLGAGVETFNFTGENIPASLRVALAAAFPAASIRFVYNTNETGALSKPPCGHLPFDSYHLAEGVEIRIYEPDETGAGDILVSKGLAPTVAVRDYRIGDVGRLRETPCACGEGQTLQILGRRGYDYIKIAGALLLQKEFERVAGICADLFDDYRAEAFEVFEEGKLKGRLVLRVFRKGGPGMRKEKEEIIVRYGCELFLSQSQTLGDFIKKGVLLPLDVEYVERPFPATYKNLKLAFRCS